jgi:anti-sigma factor RsiW
MADRTLNDDDRAELVAYLDGELEGADRERVEARLRTDPQLRIEADTYQQTWALLDRLPEPAPSPNFASRTLEQIAVLGQSQEMVGRQWPVARSLAWAAGLLLVAGLGYAVTPNKKLDVDLDSDSVYKAEPRLIENLPRYLTVENMEFLQSLDSIDLFGEDAVGR